jgi:hypothetical protein
MPDDPTPPAFLPQECRLGFISNKLSDGSITRRCQLCLTIVETIPTDKANVPGMTALFDPNAIPILRSEIHTIEQCVSALAKRIMVLESKIP